jgi:AAA domain
MNETANQKAINSLVQSLRPKQAPKGAEGNGHATDSALFSDGTVLENLFGEAQGQKWREVYNGNWTTHYESQSSADAAILHKLAFYTDRDGVQMDRIIRGSGLARGKWDSRRGGSTWLSDEIARAIENTPEGYKPKARVKVRSRSRSLGNLGMSNDPEQSLRAVSFRGREKPGPREWIVERAICKGHAATWYGESGIAKSLLGAHQGLSLAAPDVDTWAGLKIATVPVLYGDFELDETEHLRRSQELAAGMGLDDVPEEFHYLPLAGLPAEEAFGIAAEECARLGAALFIVDSVGFALDGDSEISKDVLRFHKDCLRPIKEAGATPHLIDHQAKVIKGEKYSDKQEFGSVYKTNAVRSSFQIRGAWDGNELTTTFTHRKTNFGPKVPAFSLKLVFGGGRVKVEKLEEAIPNPDRAPSKKEQVFEAVEELGRVTAEAVARKTGISLQTVRNAVSELVSEGALKDTGEKQGRSRIIVTHSQTTKGTGTGTKAQAGTSGYREAF